MTTAALGDFMVARGGSLNPADFPTEEFELYSIPAHDRGGSELVQGSEVGSAKQLVQPGDVMVSKIIPHIRRARVVGPGSGRRQIASGEWIVFRGDRFDSSYLRHFLLSDGFHREFMNTVAGVGGSLVRARPQFVKTIRFPAPSLEEQRRVATILDRSDALRAKRRQGIALIDELVQSAFLEMFGDPREWRERWPVGVIGDMAESVNYGSSAKSGAEGEWPILRMGNLTMAGRLDLTDLKYLDLRPGDVPKYTVKRGDLLFNRTNSPELVGKTAVVRTDEPLAFAGYLIRLRTTDRHNSEFISGYLNSKHGKAVLRGMNKAIVGQANINAKELQSIPIALPPKGAQDEWARRVAGLEGQRILAQRSLASLDELFASLQSRAFSGGLAALRA